MRRAGLLTLVVLVLAACGTRAPGTRGDAGGDRVDAEPGVDAPDADQAPEVAAEVGADVEVDADATADAPPVVPRSPSPWLTIGGDSFRSGFNRAELGRPPLTLAWTATIHAGGGPLWPAVSDGATVYATGRHVEGDGSVSVLALAVADGASRWRRTFALEGPLAFPEGPGQLTLAGDHLVVVCCDRDAYLHALFATTGKTHWARANGPSPIGGPFAAPLAADGALFTGRCGIEQLDGAPRPCGGTSGGGQGLSLFLSGSVYTQEGRSLWASDPKTGDVLRMAEFEAYFDPFTKPGVPASDGRRIYVVAPSKLRAFTADLSPLWVAVGGFEDGPTVANGVVLGLGAGWLKALGAATGDPLWTFRGDDLLVHPAVVAGQWAYVASNDNVYAVDLTSGAMVWHAQPGGALSIAGGHLFVAQADGKLAAYALTP